MPLYLRATPKEPGKPEVRGIDGKRTPWPDENLVKVRETARMLSARSKIQKTWEVIWVCWKGGKKPTATVVYVFHDGKRTFPKGKVGDRTHKRLADLQACMVRSKGTCSQGFDSEKVDPKTAVKGRRRKVIVECPVTIKPLRKTKPTKKKPAAEVAGTDGDE
jgi:hypothetical protein